jgi:hypothetical protein
MKRLAVVVVALSLGLVGYGAAAWSAPQQTPTERKLLKDVRVLQTKVTKLQADVRRLSTRVADTEDASGAALALGLCTAALAADALQGTWQVIDQIATATQAGKVYFGPQTPVNDTFGGQSICSVLGVTRSQALPPTTAGFARLLAP